MSKFTPGPWIDQGNEDAGWIDDANKKAVAYLCVCEDCAGDRPEEERLANRRLMVAAPDLLEACKQGLEIIKHYIDEIGPCDHAAGLCSCGILSVAVSMDKAIAKVEGPRGK